MTGTDSSQGPRLVAGRYRLAEVLGRGGMGIVWRATDELIGRTVAIKELRVPHGLSAREQAAFGERALREARTAGRIRHPGVIAIHDLIPSTAQDDALYVVMELVEAPSLATVLEEHGALPELRVARLGLRLLEALGAAHAIGLVHRDVKPSNILVLPDGKVKLVDFGIAHAVDDTRLTRTGVAGSTGYIAPELFEGRSPTPATDLWSLGVTLHHAATARSPFERESTAATIRAVLQDDPPPLDRHPALAPVIEGLLARDPDRRMEGRVAAVRLRAAITSVRDRDAAPIRQSTPPDEPAARPSTWQNRPTGISTSPPGTGRSRAAASTTGRAPANRRATGPASEPNPAAAPRQPQGQSDGGDSRPMSWEDRPTSVRNTGPQSRSMAGSRPDGQTATSATDDDAERYVIHPAKATERIDDWMLVVLSVLVVWIGWRLDQALGWTWLILFLTTGVIVASAVAAAILSPVWFLRLGTEGIRFLRARRSTLPNSHVAVAWEHVEEVVLVPWRHTGRTSRTAITMHMAESTPPEVRRRLFPPGVGRAGSGAFHWRVGEVRQSVEELNVAFRTAAPLRTAIRTPSEPNAEDLKYHRPRRFLQTVSFLVLAGILVATYLFRPGGGPVRLTDTAGGDELEFSLDGTTVASSDHNARIELWDVATREKTATLAGHTGEILAMRFSPDGSLLTTAADEIGDNTIRVWDLSTHTERRTLALGGEARVVSLAFSPDGRALAGVDEDGTIVVWDVRSGRRSVAIHERTSGAFPVRFDGTGRLLGGLDSKNRPHEWDVGTGSRASTPVDGVWARISGSDVYILDGSGARKRVLTGDGSDINDLDWAGDTPERNGLLATGSAAGAIRVWHTDSGQIAHELTLDYGNGTAAEALALSPDGKTLVYKSGSDLWLWGAGNDA
ncbi:WD40 repeat domain-containing serine/threonine protein kinase [Streptomyces echinatus]|uniref:WD40 repeat domain-containing serine/threonine protein kinase n=1 Tax=Streptomyces echinatus TaxID=67293 RepID=UPI0037AA3D04